MTVMTLFYKDKYKITVKRDTLLSNPSEYNESVSAHRLYTPQVPERGIPSGTDPLGLVFNQLLETFPDPLTAIAERMQILEIPWVIRYSMGASYIWYINPMAITKNESQYDELIACAEQTEEWFAGHVYELIVEKRVKWTSEEGKVKYEWTDHNGIGGQYIKDLTPTTLLDTAKMHFKFV